MDDRDDARWRRTTAEVALPGLAASSGTAAESVFDPPRERFEVIGELGRGGMGKVVVALDVALQRPVAIKQLIGAGDRARFEREVRITARLEHPSIVPVHDAGRDGHGEPYYVMRRITGAPLVDRVRGGLRERLALVPHVLAVADAAAFAHDRGIVHRDIKPWNVLLGEHGETWLIDWGLARVLDGRGLPAAGSAAEGQRGSIDGPSPEAPAGTPGFMAPEQARGEPADARVDVFALGATLAYVLTGKADGALGEVPEELAAIVESARAASAEARYANAGELAADLRRFLTGQLVAAHRYSAGERVRRWLRAHRVVVTASGVALVAIAVVAALAVANVVRERDAANVARGEAALRADQMLVERASELAARAPVQAVAALAGLPAGSPMLARARDIAAVAAAGGIARGVVAHRGAVRGLALRGDQLASTGDDGAIRVHDLARGTSQTWARREAAGGYVEWLDGAVAYSAARGLRLVNAAGQVRVLDADARLAALWPVAGGLRYVDQTRQALIEHAAGDGVVIAANVRAAAGRGPLAIVDGSDGVRAVIGTQVTALSREHASALAVSDASLAAAIGGEVIVWDAATRTERGRWALANVNALLPAPGCWLAATHGAHAALYRLCAAAPAAVLHGDWEAAWSAPTTTGVAVATTSGALALLDATGLHAVAHGVPGVLALAAAGDRVALGGIDGVLRWWSASAIAPAPQPLRVDGELVGADRAHAYLLDHAAMRIARQDGMLLGDGPVVFAGAVARTGELVVTRLPGDGHPADQAVLDTQTGVTRMFPGASLVVADRVTGRVVFARGADVIAAEHATAVPGNVAMLATAGGWTAALTERRALVRIARDGAEAHLLLWATPTEIVVDTRGTVWLALDRALWSWDGHALRCAAILPSPIAGLVAAADGAAVVLRDHALWYAAGHAVTSRLASGDRRVFTFGERSALVSEGALRTRIALATGERTTWRSEAIETSRAFAAGDGAFVVQTREPGRSWLTRYTDAVPASPLALPAWLSTITNARLDASGALIWPDATR